MRSAAEAAFGALLACAFTATTVAVASSQTTATSSPPDDARCSVVEGGKGVNDGRTVFPQGGLFRIQGDPGCAEPNGSLRVTATGDRSAFGNATFRSLADGSYRSPWLRLPSHLALGPQDIVVVTEGGRAYVSPILIFEAEVEPTPTPDALGASGVLTTPAATTGGGRASGTRNSLLRYMLGAIAFLAGGAVLVLAAIRHGWQWHAIRRAGLRLGRRRHTGALALPEPDIPSLDTRGFVPHPPKTVPARRDSETEADVLEYYLGSP